MSHATSVDKEAWIAHFDKEISDWAGEETDDHALGGTLKEFSSPRRRCYRSEHSASNTKLLRTGMSPFGPLFEIPR